MDPHLTRIVVEQPKSISITTTPSTTLSFQTHHTQHINIMTTEQNIVHNDHEDNEHQSQKRAKPNPIIEKELNLSIIHSEELSKFIPNDFPTTIDENGRIPLRRQIFNDKKVLRTVLTKPKKGVYMCNHCDKIFNTFGELLDHFGEFNVKRPHKCSFDDCPWKIVGFNRIRQLHRHEKSVHSTEKDFKCNVPNCNKKFGRVDLLNRHIKSVHENKTSRFNKKMSKEQQQQQQSNNSNLIQIITLQMMN
ncbi:unnamed protein product [Wickerhamomyces anomalus]